MFFVCLCTGEARDGRDGRLHKRDVELFENTAFDRVRPTYCARSWKTEQFAFNASILFWPLVLADSLQMFFLLCGDIEGGYLHIYSLLTERGGSWRIHLTATRYAHSDGHQLCAKVSFENSSTSRHTLHHLRVVCTHAPCFKIGLHAQ